MFNVSVKPVFFVDLCLSFVIFLAVFVVSVHRTWPLVAIFGAHFNAHYRQNVHCVM